MKAQFIVGVVLFAFGIAMLVQGHIWGVIFVIVGGIVARTGGRGVASKKIQDQRQDQDQPQP